jgi:ABC-type sugar transport system permease subunit
MRAALQARALPYLQPNGTINDALTALGLPAVSWLSSQTGAIWALVLTNIWRWSAAMASSSTSIP